MFQLFQSLPTRIVAFVFGAILLTSLTVMGLSVRSTDRFLRAEVNQKFPTVLTAKAEKLEAWYALREGEMAVFAESEILLDNLGRLQDGRNRRSNERAAAETEQYLRYVLDGFDQYETIFILGRDGQALLAVGADLELPDARRLEIAGTDVLTIGPSERLGARAIQIVSTPIGTGEEAPTLHAVFDVSILRDELSSEDLGRTGEVFIVGPEGRVIVSTDDQVSDVAYMGPLPGPNDATIVDDYEQDGGERLVGGALRLERFGWSLVVTEPYQEVFAPVVEAMSDVLLINLAIVLLVGIAAFRIAVSIVRPIEALSSAARRISEGERGVEIPASDSQDEVGVLTRALSEMTQRLTRNAAELESSHAAVEEANERLQLQNEELQSVNEVLEQLSITDGLTKLHNHRHFQEVLLNECKRSDRSERPLSLILIDIDRFKHWNDRLGHAGGDEILRKMAAVLADLIRETDLLARYGGEEFALITTHTDLEGAVLLAEKIRAEVAGTEFLLNPPSEREPVTVSIGVATYSGDRVRLFNEADRALYLAKESGRDCVMTANDLPT